MLADARKVLSSLRKNEITVELAANLINDIYRKKYGDEVRELRIMSKAFNEKLDDLENVMKV